MAILTWLSQKTQILDLLIVSPHKNSHQMCENIIDSKLKISSEVFTIYLSFWFMPRDRMIYDNWIWDWLNGYH